VTSAPPDPPETPAPPASFRRRVFGDVLVAIGTLLLANVLLGAGVAVVHGVRLALSGQAMPENPMTAELMPQLIVAAVFATLLAALVTWWVRARTLSPLPTMRSAVAYPLAILAGIGIQAVCIGLSALASLSGAPIVPSNADPLEQLAQQAPWLMWGIAVVVAPVAEELLFRHVLVRRFALAGRAALGIVLTSLLFAAMHEPVPGDAGVVAWLSAVALYMAMGAGFGAVYVRTGRLGAAIAAHAACNLAAVSVAAFSTL
jgi:membrane protease YdiL (CAAX protease family)